MQQMFSCPSCGAQNEIGQQFCITCGRGIHYICPHCGATQEEEAQRYVVGDYIGEQSKLEDDCIECFRSFTATRIDEENIRVNVA